MIYHKKITNNEITISEIINDIEGLLYGKNNWNENNNNSSLGENEDDSNKFCKIDLNEDVSGDIEDSKADNVPVDIKEETKNIELMKTKVKLMDDNDLEGLLLTKPFETNINNNEKNENENENNEKELIDEEDKNDKDSSIVINDNDNNSSNNNQSDVNEEEIKNLESKLNNMRFKDEEPIYIYTKMEKKRKAITENIFDSLYINKSKK